MTDYTVIYRIYSRFYIYAMSVLLFCIMMNFNVISKTSNITKIPKPVYRDMGKNTVNS